MHIRAYTLQRVRRVQRRVITSVNTDCLMRITINDRRTRFQRRNGGYKRLIPADWPERCSSRTNNYSSRMPDYINRLVPHASRLLTGLRPRIHGSKEYVSRIRVAKADYVLPGLYIIRTLG